MITKFLNRLCWWLFVKFPSRVRIIRTDGDPYLIRFYIKYNRLLPGIYLHKFLRSDKDRELHNHPWKWSFSLLLTEGYLEERWNGERVEKLERKAGTINIIRANDFHRVELLDVGPWTLFISGPETQDWGFMNPETGVYIPHMEYLGLTEPFLDRAEEQ